MARQREFDTTEVLGKAILLFWERGYEATSMRNLIDAMGISTSSLYTVFGDKRGVYLAALAQFCQQERARIDQMAHAAPTPEQFIEGLFASVETAAQPGTDMQGSLAFNAMVEFGTRDHDVTQLLFAHYLGIAQIVADLLAQGQQRGTISNRHDAHDLAFTILSALHGVATVKGVKPDFPHAAAIARVIIHLMHS